MQARSFKACWLWIVQCIESGHLPCNSCRALIMLLECFLLSCCAVDFRRLVLMVVVSQKQGDPNIDPSIL